MKISYHCAFSAAVLLLIPMSLPAQGGAIDWSACRGMHAILRAMRDGAPKEQVSDLLDGLLETEPYKVLFRHYNRPWRPNHLPRDVFKRMILSLQFEKEYASGENERADSMRIQWKKYYPGLALYERQLRELSSQDLPRLLDDGVRYAQSWLPPEWKIPPFRVFIIPNGGSPAFSIDDVNGYDFLQLAQERPGELSLNWLLGTIAHESHHQGMRSTASGSLSPSDSMALRVIGLCIAEGAATEFISGPPAGRAPAFAGGPFHVFSTNMKKAWKAHVDEEEDILRHQITLLDQALAGELTEELFNAQMREYWLNGLVGRAYVLGSDMFAAIYLAFGRPGVFSVMEDPRKLFEVYNQAIDAQPEALRRCVRVPEKAVKQALAIGISPY